MLVSCGQKPAKHRHSLVEHEAVAATCTEEGSSLYYSCEGCGKYFSDAQGQNEIEENSWVVAALGHDLQEHAAVNPTCTEPGNSLYYTCSRCDKHFSDAEAQHEIQENSWVIPATGHTLTHHDGHEATCTEVGNIEYWTCDVCEKYYSDSEGQTEISQAQTIINALGHNLTKHPAVDPTCVDMGNSEYYSCDRCNKYFSDAQGQNQITANSWLIPATGHSTVLHEAHDATCTEAGNSAYYSCEHCSRYFSDAEAQHQIEANSWIIPALGHDLSHHDGHEATCEQAGSSEYWSCSRCGKFFSDSQGETEIEENSWVIAALGHNLQQHDAVPATCTEAGSSLYYECDRCGKFFSDAGALNEIDENSWIIPATGHTNVEDPNCLGKVICSECGEFICSAAPTIDFQTNGIYGMYDWFKGFGVADPGWAVADGANSILFYTYATGGINEVEVMLPRMYFVGFDYITIDLLIEKAGEKYSFDEDLSSSFIAPSASYTAKFVFNNISDTSMTVSLLDGSNTVVISKVVTDANVLTGVDGFKFYASADGLGTEHLVNFTFVESHEHNYVVDQNCIGKEVCSECYAERGVADPTIDFTSSLYGAYDCYDPWGSAVAQDGWAKADNAGQISFVNYTAGDICRFHLPRMYFAGFSSVSIDVVVNYNDVVYALDSDFTSSFTTPFAGYSLKVVFENITSSSMDVKILDAFGTTQVQATCSDSNVLNGLEGFVIYTIGSGNVGWDAFSNFTFVA